MIFDFSCDLGHIQNDVPHQLWEAISADSGSPLWLTRLLHNKPLFYANNFLKCYLSYLSPDFLNKTFSLLGLILFGLGLWHLVTNKRWVVLTILLLAPLSPLFDQPPSGLAQTIILYSAEILVMLYGLKNVWQRFFF